MSRLQLAACLASVSTAALLMASPAAAQSYSAVEATRVLLPFSTLNSTPEGRAALAANLATVVTIANTSSAAQREHAIADNTLIMGGGSIAPGLGAKLDAVFQANASSTNAVLGTTGTAGRVIRGFSSLALSDAVVAKNFFAFGGADTRTAAPVPVFAGLTLPTGGIFDIYDVAYGVNPLYSRNVNGNTRPYHLPGAPINIYTSIQGGSNDASAAFPSGHATLGAAEAILLAIMVPERYGELMARAADEGYSRLVLGVHYPTDVIGGRILSTFEMVQILSNNPNYTGISAGGTPLVADRAAQMTAATAALRAMLEAGCGGTIAACAGAFDPASELTFRAQKAEYLYRMTYGLPNVGPTNLAPVVPVDAEVLLATRFPYLTAAQRRDVIGSTEIASGSALDNGQGWARINLFDAANGYGALTGNVDVAMNAASGGFNAFDVWRNNIGGTGSLIKSGTGTLVLTGANNTWGGTTTINAGTLRVTSFGSLPATTAVTNNGTLSMADANTGGRLRVASYAGAGGTIVLDVRMPTTTSAAAATGDRLTLTGAVAPGTTATIVLNDLSSGLTGVNLGEDGLLLVEATGAPLSAFTLAGAPITRGLYTYALQAQSAGIVLASTPSPAGQKLQSVPFALEELSAAASEIWQDHQAVLRDSEEQEFSAWASAFARSTHTGRFTTTDIDSTGLVMGADAAVPGFAPMGGSLRISGQIGYSDATQNFSAGASEAGYNGLNLGVGASLTFGNGFFADLAVRQDQLRMKASTLALGALGSANIPKTDFDIFAVAGTIGYRMSLGETAFFEPSLRLSSAQGDGSVDGIASHTVSWDTGDGVQARIGLRAGAVLKSDSDSKTRFSVELASLHNSSDERTTSFTTAGAPDAVFLSPIPEQVGEIRFGLEHDSESWSAGLKAGARDGDDYQSYDVSATVRLRF